MTTKIDVIGELRVSRDGEPVALPPSKKTRALLAYLLLEERPVRRERLCEMFWDLPDDPRGALRWSLSKIRRALGDEAHWLVADRERVELRVPPRRVDLMSGKAPGNGEIVLEGVDMPDSETFSLWLADLRRRVEEGMFGPGAGGDDPARTAPSDAEPNSSPQPELEQVIRYTRAEDGTRIAYACTGKGPCVIKAANWLTHLDLELSSPVWGRMLAELSEDHELVRYDERGSGLSDWDVEDLSLDAFVRDLETVVDAIGCDRFPLIGISQGAPVGIEFACRHPEKVSCLILIGGYATGWRHSDDEALKEARSAALTLVRHGWGENNPAYRQIFSHSFFPDATPAEIDWFNRFQRASTSTENAVRFLETFSTIDVRARLEQVGAPTLVIHSRGDQRVTLEQAREFAAAIPNASLLTLDSSSHLPMSREPAFALMMERMKRFIADNG